MAEHDNAYKFLFSHARMVEDLLKGFVREEWVDHLDFSTLEKVNGSYVSDDLRGREDDVIWRVRWGRDWLYVYLLLEFQSSVDQWMAVRIMTYVGLLYQDLIRSGQVSSGDRLPPVLPVVLYNGESTWTAATDVSLLVQDIPGGLGRYRPHLRYLLLAERDFCDADLQSLNNLVAALFRLENSRNPEQLLQVVTSLLQWLGAPGQGSLRRAFTVWFSRVLFPAHFEENAQPVLEELDEVQTMLAERVKEWNRQSMENGLRKGIKKGLQQGLQKGLQQGQRRSARRILVRLMEKKFGPIPDEFAERIGRADEEQLVLWAERVLTAETPGEVFGN